MKILNTSKFLLMLSALIVSTQNPIFAADEDTSYGDKAREAVRSVPKAVGQGAVSAGKSAYQGILDLKSKQDGLKNRLKSIKADTEKFLKTVESLKGRTLSEAQINTLGKQKDKIVGAVNNLKAKGKDAKNNYAKVAKTEVDAKKLARNEQKITETDTIINSANAYSQQAIGAFEAIGAAR
jgi:hypothetical protein